MHNQLNFRGLTINFGNAGVAAGTTSTITTTAATNAAINGLFATPLALAANQASPTTDAATGAAFKALTPNQATALVIGTNTAGALRVVQGSIEKTQVGVTTTVGAFDVLPQFPTLPDDFVPLAYALVRTAPSAATWTPGSSSWAASGVTATFRNVSTLPERPQAS
jgi:hypothetical protein